MKKLKTIAMEQNLFLIFSKPFLKEKLSKRLFIFPKKFFLSFLLFFFLSLPFVSAKSPEVFSVILDGDTINPVTADYIIQAIDETAKEQAELLIIKLDTPGGLLESTRLIVKKIMASKIPVVVYVAPSGARAGSAGVFITYASHIAAMAPSTNIGAAHPVNIGGGDAKRRTFWDAARDLIDDFRKPKKRKKEIVQAQAKTKEGKKTILEGKILHDSVAFIKALAKERERNVEWAIKSVEESDSITAEEALKLGVVEYIAQDEQDLLKQLNRETVKIKGEEKVLRTTNVIIKEISMDFRQKLLNVLANPTIAYILLMLGFYGLLFEVTHPGFGVPGVLGIIFLILAFFSMQMLPISYAGFALLILGLILLTAEAFVAGFGLLALGGTVCLVLGSLFLFESYDAAMRVSISVILSSAVVGIGISLFLLKMVIHAHRRKSISGKEGLIGSAGNARTNLSPEKEGKVYVQGTLWSAVAKEAIPKGNKIKVIKIDGLILEVEKLNPNSEFNKL